MNHFHIQTSLYKAQITLSDTPGTLLRYGSLLYERKCRGCQATVNLHILGHFRSSSAYHVNQLSVSGGRTLGFHKYTPYPTLGSHILMKCSRFCPCPLTGGEPALTFLLSTGEGLGTLDGRRVA